LNYVNYFTEIETRFQQRRGTLLLLSTLDWALIETWREAGIPLEIVLRGIDAAFDKHDAQKLRAGKRRVRQVNGLAWCAQAIMEAAEQAREAAAGMNPADASATSELRDSGFEAVRIARFLSENAARLRRAAAAAPESSRPVIAEAAVRLDELTLPLAPGASATSGLSLEDLDRALSVLEERLIASLLAAAPESDIAALREQADREMAPFRGRMQAHQVQQVRQQFLQKRLLERYSIPRLSLFYMPHEEL
jgi:hypothetical protein